MMTPGSFANRVDAAASIDTTMKYYVDIDSDHIAAELWVKFGKDKTAPEKTDLGAV